MVSSYAAHDKVLADCQHLWRRGGEEPETIPGGGGATSTSILIVRHVDIRFPNNHMMEKTCYRVDFELTSNVVTPIGYNFVS